ncbi:phosphatase PAP2 family protein [Paenibacillus sp. N3.4]|uniref:phosphatase PAP2 family protein n=1 Tax=Paenibacillus sp. N3.4 TaxID=2603222 RepID=UPI0011C6F592|nr:phosphatase PAP2 family protein [Paenibacillus sp. N3.4]TXK83910.1 phosphatase PAP2 family protein [Paenibacillus sp. N3.4]
MRTESFKSHLIPLMSLFTIPLLGLIYVYLNHARGKAYNLVTDLDQQIPFVKIFILPYVSWYGFLFIAFLYFSYKNREVFVQTLLQINMGQLICYVIYAIFQTHVQRPELAGNDALLQMVQWVYRSDQPYNCFPSIHVLTSYLVMRAYWSTGNIPRAYKYAVTFMAMAIIASTLFIKQHVLLDIAGACLVAEVVVCIESRLLRKSLSRLVRSFMAPKTLHAGSKDDMREDKAMPIK